MPDPSISKDWEAKDPAAGFTGSRMRAELWRLKGDMKAGTCKAESPLEVCSAQLPLSYVLQVTASS